MNRADIKVPRSASALAILPIAGLVGGLILGALGAWLASADELTSLRLVIRYGAAGFFFGLVLILLGVCVQRLRIKSIGGLTVLVAVAALLLWYATRVLYAVLG
jgi:hypothetical protein